MFCTACGTREPRRSRFCASAARRCPAASTRRRRTRRRSSSRVRSTRVRRRVLRGGPPGRGRRAAAGLGAAGGQARPERGQPVPARPGRDHGRAAPGQRHLPRRRDRLAPARRVPPGGRRLRRARRRHRSTARTSTGERIDVAAAGRRRRGADRQVPAASTSTAAVEPAVEGRGVTRGELRGGQRPGPCDPDASVRSSAQLRAEFPDITISKIRFLEAEGLVHPERTPSGYRKFSSGDVARLRYVLAEQRDHYLPLRVIKDQLDAIDRGLEPPDRRPGQHHAGAGRGRSPRVTAARRGRVRAGAVRGADVPRRAAQRGRAARRSS